MLDYGEPDEERQGDRNDEDQEMEELNPHIAPEEVFGEDDDARSRVKLYSFEGAAASGASNSRLAVETAGDLSEQDMVLMGQEDVSQPPPSRPDFASELNLRPEALHLFGMPVTQCSTSRLFAYVAHWGALPLGIEWVNDFSCNVVFADALSALQALELLCPPATLNPAAEADPRIPYPGHEVLQAASTEGLPDRFSDVALDSVFAPRRARRLPAKFYLPTEKEAALAAASALPPPTLPDDVPEIYRELAAEDAERETNSTSRESLSKLRGSLFVRFAVDGHDVKERKSAKKSTWYRTRGIEAGKDIVPRLLEVGAVGERAAEPPTRDIPVEEQRRAQRPRENAYERERQRRELDAELDLLQNPGSRRRDRSASPSGAGAIIRVRGRGKNKAPLPVDHPEWAYVDARDRSDVARAGSGAFRGRMVADELDDRNERGAAAGWKQYERGAGRGPGWNAKDSAGADTEGGDERRGAREGQDKRSSMHERVFGSPQGYKSAQTQSLASRIS